MSNNELAMLVVLYGCELDESNTLHSLEKLSSELKGVKLVIWNNGPNYLNEKVVSSFKSKLDFELIQTVENISLAKIYNKFINKANSNNYLFLDHDSELNESYLRSAKYFYGKVGVAKIYSRGTLHSPVENKKLFSSKKEITAIGSGLILSKEIVGQLMKKYGSVFDERFLLYGVDTTLFYRLDSIIDIKTNLKLLPRIEHSLSSNEVETKDVSEFRNKERSYDFGLRVVFYPSLDRAYLLLVVLVKSIFRCSPLKLKYITNAIFTRKHYRKKCN